MRDTPHILEFLVAPSRSFARLAAHPRFVVAYLLVVLVTGCAVALTIPNVDMFAAARALDPGAAGEPPGPSELAATAAMLRTMQLVHGFLGPAMGYPAAALGLLVVFRAFTGRSPTFVASLAVVCHGALALTLRAVLIALVADARGGISLKDLDRGTVLASNLAAVLPGDTPSLLVDLLAAFDSFTVFALVAMGIGYAKLLRLEPARTIPIVVAAWLFAVVLPSILLTGAMERM